MAQSSYYWGGTVTGDASAAPYSDDEFSDIWRKLFTRDRTLQGVIGGYLNELEVTNPAGVTVRAKSGAAVVDGKFYENTANVDFSAGVAGTYYVVLRKTWATQQVRLALIGPAVAPTQTDGVTWEISIAEITSTGAAITNVYDRRRYIMRGPSRRVLVPVRDAADAAGRVDWDELGYTMEDNEYTNVWAEWFVPNDYYANLKVNPLIVADSPATGNIWLANWYVIFGPWAPVNPTFCGSDTWGDYNSLDGSLVAHTLSPTDSIICGPELDFSALDYIRPNDYMHFVLTRDGSHVNDTLNDDCYIQGFMLEYDSIT